MSKENVALFVRMTATKRDISTRASAERSAAKWAEIGKSVGLSFDENDVVGFVSEVTGKRVTSDNAIQEFLSATSSAGTTATSAPIQYTADLQKQLVRAGYTPPGGIGGATYQFPPDPVPPSVGLDGGIKRGGD
jgi:hypothetical protein